MNTTTKQLIEQAGFGLGSFGFDSDPEMACGSVKDLEKFAELLIKEAIKTVQSVGDKASNDIPFEVTDLFVSQLRQRFGVKE